MRALMDLSSRWEEEREAALEWINCNAVKAFSFLWVVRMLDLEVSSQEIRHKARQEYDESLDYYGYQLKTEGRPWRERVFELS